jgi:hypothetical protein
MMGGNKPDTLELLAVVRGWAERHYPGWRPDEVGLKLIGPNGESREVKLPIPLTLPVLERPVPFVPNVFQESVLEALEGKALRTDALGAAVGDRGRLYKPGGLKELREAGMVKHHPRLGFYRPDAPPEELIDEVA